MTRTPIPEVEVYADPLTVRHLGFESRERVEHQVCSYFQPSVIFTRRCTQISTWHDSLLDYITEGCLIVKEDTNPLILLVLETCQTPFLFLHE